MKPSLGFVVQALLSDALRQEKVVPMTNIINTVLHGSDKHTAVTKHASGSVWKHDCGLLVPTFSRNRKLAMLQEENPGAGMNPDEAVPFVKVLKDGFHMVDCVKDAMYEHGDKFGDNKFQYKMEDVSNSSIVHYTDIVPKEDREKMSSSVCFEFCRGLEDMVFFGISNGRDCYCTSYYKPMAGDSSSCDSVCEGEASEMCGGKKKSSIWSMHMCDTMEEDMKKALEDGEAVHFHLDDICGKIKHEVEEVSVGAADMQKVFGQLGDPAASNLLQKAKVYSGEWIHRDDVCLKHSAELEESREEADGKKDNDFTQYDERKEAEDALAALQEATAAAGKEVGAIVADWALAQPQAGAALKYLPTVLAQYYSIMYFIDKEFEDDSVFPVTCDGNMIGEPVLGARPEDCAAACDTHMDCVGFASFAQTEGEHGGYTCFLFSKFTSAQYYTGCDSDKEALVQLRGAQHRNVSHGHLAGFSRRSFHAGGNRCEKKRSQSTCEQKRASEACLQARKATGMASGDDSTPDHCFLLPDNRWKHSDLPNYFQCLDACCVDFDPKRIFDGITCEDILTMQDCPSEIDAYVPPNTNVAHICPVTCDNCDAPKTFVPPPKKPKVPAQIPVKELENVVVAPKKAESIAKAPILAMCRAKFSEFSGVSLKPDPSGKSKFALKELTKADRCAYD